jgi:hypothetical protein
MQPQFYLRPKFRPVGNCNTSADRHTHFLRQPADPLAGVDGTGRHLALHAPAQSIKKISVPKKVTKYGGFRANFRAKP